MLHIKDIAGKTFVFSVDVKAKDGATVGNDFVVKMMDKKFIYPDVIPWNKPVGESWTRITGKITFPKDTIELNRITLYRANKKGTIYYTNCSLVEEKK